MLAILVCPLPRAIFAPPAVDFTALLPPILGVPFAELPVIALLCLFALAFVRIDRFVDLGCIAGDLRARLVCASPASRDV